MRKTCFYVHLSHNKNTSPRITDRTNCTKTAKRAQRHALTKTRTEETEQTVPQHTHMCMELCTQSLEGSEDSLSLLPALLPGCPVCPQSCLCVSKSRHKQLTLEGSTKTPMKLAMGRPPRQPNRTFSMKRFKSWLCKHISKYNNEKTFAKILPNE